MKFKIEILIVQLQHINLNKLDPSFSWESEQVPSVGDGIYCKVSNLPIDVISGDVRRRTFYVGENRVSLMMDIDKTDTRVLRDYLYKDD
jgi:hypothetical protein